MPRVAGLDLFLHLSEGTPSACSLSLCLCLSFPPCTYGQLSSAAGAAGCWKRHPSLPSPEAPSEGRLERWATLSKSKPAWKGQSSVGQLAQLLAQPHCGYLGRLSTQAHSLFPLCRFLLLAAALVLLLAIVAADGELHSVPERVCGGRFA